MRRLYPPRFATYAVAVLLSTAMIVGLPLPALAACSYGALETNASQVGSWGYSATEIIPSGSTCADVNVYNTSDAGNHAGQYNSGGSWVHGSNSPVNLAGGSYNPDWIPIQNIQNGSSVRFGYQGATSFDDSIIYFFD